MVDFDLCAGELEEEQREPNEVKPGNHDGTGSSRRETKGDKPGNHDETGSSRRETKAKKPGNHDETGSGRRETKGDKPGNHDMETMTKQDPVEGRQREKPRNHVVTKSVSLKELRTPSAEAVWGTLHRHRPQIAFQWRSWRETSLGDKAAAAAKRSPEGKSWRGPEWRSWRETSLGDKAAAALRPFGDFGNQQPSHWEVRTPIASSYLGKKSKP